VVTLCNTNSFLLVYLTLLVVMKEHLYVLGTWGIRIAHRNIKEYLKGIRRH